MIRIAALQDDPAQALLTEQALMLRGHRCVRFRDARALMLALRREPWDMLLLDWDHRGLGAADILHWIRTTLGAPLPILLLADADDDAAMYAGLARCADGLVFKPVGPAELAGRVEALARRIDRTRRALSDVALGHYQFEVNERRAWLRGQPVHLARKEFDLAVLLFRHAGELVLRQTLLDRIWGRTVPEGSRTLDSHLSRIRTRLALCPSNGVRLSTVEAAGWRLDVMQGEESWREGTGDAAGRRSVPRQGNAQIQVPASAV
ncbi:response regulator transcription factor [Cupriavidus sp. AU9028]|uniref:response regulator transcription factor n=1 Tax=Cupriavidus sp. AU9028 TaxID=2871157 RepID=UPI0021072305|nr:response regulator transcription factor [Cupriavidus sp. AU9028]